MEWSGLTKLGSEWTGAQDFDRPALVTGDDDIFDRLNTPHPERRGESRSQWCELKSLVKGSGCCRGHHECRAARSDRSLDLEALPRSRGVRFCDDQKCSLFRNHRFPGQVNSSYIEPISENVVDEGVEMTDRLRQRSAVRFGDEIFRSAMKECDHGLGCTRQFCDSAYQLILKTLEVRVHRNCFRITVEVLEHQRTVEGHDLETVILEGPSLKLRDSLLRQFFLDLIGKGSGSAE